MKIPSYVWILAIILIGGIFLVILSNNKNNQLVANASLPVQVEVFADYNCSHCADFAPFVEKVKSMFGDKLNLQNKHLPFLAASSTEYAYAAESARLQGKFDEFNTQLFAWISYKRDPENKIYTYSDDDKTFYTQEVDVSLLAQRLGLDIDKFESDRQSAIVVNIIQSQKTDVVKRLGTTSTPTVFIYGVKFDMKTYDDLENKVREIINKIEEQK